MKKTGTKEWAEKNINIQRGCENDCRYCYAKEMAVRAGRCTKKQWTNPVINQAKVDKNYRKRRGVVMFPSTHDITENNFIRCVDVLEKLLKAGNQVLIVTKPRLVLISTMCDLLEEYRQQIVFRFTIGSTSDEVLKFWEPNAPNFLDRLNSLKYAHNNGFQTSVSCEPYLDCWIEHLYKACYDYITDSFWIGKLRQFKRRVDMKDVTGEQIVKYVKPLLNIQKDYFVRGIYTLLNEKPYIRWKDSIREVITCKR